MTENEKLIMYTAQHGVIKAGLYAGLNQKQLYRKFREMEELERRRQDSWQTACRKYVKEFIDPKFTVSYSRQPSTDEPVFEDI